MATFVKQASNLSALGGALQSLSSVLDVSTDSIARRKDDQREQAELFLQSQRERVAEIDKHLLQAAGAILPAKPEMKTATELAELCRLVQEVTRQKLKLLKRELEARGATDITLEERNSFSPATPQQHPLLKFSIGGPLESVIEGDVETEGATTPGSLIQPSPFYSATRRRKSSITPTTPTMDKFSFSAGTNSLINNMTSTANIAMEATDETNTPTGIRHSVTPVSKMTRSSMGRSFDRQLRFDEFQEEDDMITLESRSTVAAKSPSSRAPKSPANEEKSQFLARMESMLERVEESILESRPSDEMDMSGGCNSRSTRFSLSFQHDGNIDGDNEDCDDDSTNVVATQVALQSINEGLKRTRISPGKGLYRAKSLSKVERPAQIFVDTAAGSPAHTNITMDMTVMHDTFTGMSILGDDDNSSTVTPVLDRYRLDPDDNSIGIKVVPNKRGTHGKRDSATFAKTIHDVNPDQRPEFYTSPDGVRSPSGLPGSVSARKKTYRKTPFPKQQYDNFSVESIDENFNPNIPTGGAKYRKTPFPKKHFGNESFQSEDGSDRSLQSRSPLRNDMNPSNPGLFSIPPLRPRSFETAKTSAPMRSTSTPRSLSFPAPRASRSPLSDAYISKHLGSENSENKMEETSNHPMKEGLEKRAKWMERITMAEYERAAKVVREQVNREEANDALEALEDFLTLHVKDNPRTPEFTEKQGYQVLRDVLGNDKKSKSVLMSLCHWRRLLMFRDQDHGMIFQVNQFEQ